MGEHKVSIVYERVYFEFGLFLNALKKSFEIQTLARQINERGNCFVMPFQLLLIGH